MIITLPFLSCEKQDKVVIKSEIDETGDNKLKEELKILANSIGQLYKESDFKDYVYSEIDKKFDGDYNTLLKNIEKGYHHSDILKGGNSGMSMNYFKDQKLFPQIYIPFYDELNKKGKLGKSSPAILIYTDENESGQYEGFKIDKNGDLIKLDFLLTEDYAKNNEVWVISINERVDESGAVSTNQVDPLVALSFLSNNDKINPITFDGTKGSLACTPPSVPQNLQTYPFLPKSVNLQWQDIQGVAYYKIYRDINFSGNYVALTTVNYPSCSYSDNNLTVGNNYSYKVQAFNATDCYSALSYSSGAYASWRTNNYNDLISTIYISKDCWNWCCGWPEGAIELKYRIVKYNKLDQQVEYPKNSLPQTGSAFQKGLWAPYFQTLFRWDITKYAYNYLLFFYEDDGGNDNGLTIKLSTSFKPKSDYSVEASISFTIDDKDEELGWVEIYHSDPSNKEYSLAPRKGSAKIKLIQQS
jgi:hypothetical protein